MSTGKNDITDLIAKRLWEDQENQETDQDNSVDLVHKEDKCVSLDAKKCIKCDFIPKHKVELRQHLKQVHDIKLLKCDQCEYRTYDKEYLKTHLITHAGQKPHECEICSFKTAKKYLLNRHLKLHTGKNLHHCTICGYRANQKYGLLQHMRSHTGERPFNCEQCEYKARTAHQLKVHTMRVHSGESIYECDVCGLKTGDKTKLTIHMRIHNGDKPFECEICGMKLNQKSSLLRHLKVHVPGHKGRKRKLFQKDEDDGDNNEKTDSAGQVDVETAVKQVKEWIDSSNPFTKYQEKWMEKFNTTKNDFTGLKKKDEDLIELVRQHSVIYDPSHPKYMDIAFKEAVWKKIGEKIEIDGATCRSRWRNMRECYRRSFQKTIKINGQFTIKYKYSQQLAFLKKYLNIIKGGSKSSQEEDNSGNDDRQDTKDEIEKLQSLPIGEEISKSDTQIKTKHPTKRKLQKSSKQVRHETDVSAEIQTIHSVDAFLTEVSATLKTFTPYYVNLAKSEIFSVVQKYEMLMLVQQELPNVPKLEQKIPITDPSPCTSVVYNSHLATPSATLSENHEPTQNFSSYPVANDQHIMDNNNYF